VQLSPFRKIFIHAEVTFYTGIVSTLLFVLTIVLLAVNLNRELNYKYGIVVESKVVL
jgi:hypothetical protein